MRHPIETVPKDGTVVILEDDRGTCEFAHWSAEARAWVRESGELNKITPRYWHPTRRDEYLLQEGDEFVWQKESGSSGLASGERRSSPFPRGPMAPQWTPAAGDGIALGQVTKTAPAVIVGAQTGWSQAERGQPGLRQLALSIATAIVAVSLVGLYFRAEVASYLARYTGEDTSDLRHEDKVNWPSSLAARRDATQLTQGAKAMAPEARQPLEVALASKAADEAALTQTAESAASELRQSLQKERNRAEALASELARAQADNDTQVALAIKMRDQAAQVTRAADTSTAELRNSLQKERERAEALASELAMARRDIDTQVALASKVAGETAKFKPAAEGATAELRQSLQRERDRAETLASELAMARRDIDTQLALASKMGDESLKLKQTAESVTAELRQSLQKEHDRAEALANELAMARREIDTQLALASKTGDESVKLKQTAESVTAELRQSLQKEHDRAEALASELAIARRDNETQVALASKMGDESVKLTQTAESVTAELQKGARQGRGTGQRIGDSATRHRHSIGAGEQDGRREREAQADCRECDGGAAEGARQDRGTGQRIGDSATRHRHSGGAGEQGRRRNRKVQVGRRGRDIGTATVTAEGAGQGRCAGNRTGDGAAC